MSPQSQANTPLTELDAALEYARSGIPVFPCNPLDKKPLTMHGFKDATTDETQIRAWWAKWPNAMIAAPTGAASGMWIVDVDKDSSRKIDGEATLTQLVIHYGDIPETLMTITPRGGRHYIFRWNNSIEIRNSAGRIGPGIDVRGEGGYVCLPPSRNADGGIYQWDPDSADQAVIAPDWLVELARKKGTAWARAALDYECKAVAHARRGTRNTTLNTATFNLHQLVAGGRLDGEEVHDRLLEAAQACGLVADDGMAAVEATIASGAKAGSAQPRSQPRPRPPVGPRPVIQIIDGQRPRVLQETENALLTSGLPIFSRGSWLVEPIAETMLAADGRQTVAAQLRLLSSDSLTNMAAEAATFQKYNRKRNAWVDIDPPVQIMQAVLANARAWKFPHVSGIITAPTLRPDGSLLDEPGYDPETELYLLPGFGLPPIPEQPSKDEAGAARDKLTDLFSEFCFKGKKPEAEWGLNRAIALSGVLTALVRGSLPTAPIHLIRAHVPGTGKSYLVDAIAMIATGRLCPVVTALRNKEETEKRLGSILLSGIPIVSLDNVTHDLGGELLSQLTERPLIKIRILGRSEMPDCECHAAVFSTGNNVTFRADMGRRGLICNLETFEERPELHEFQKDVLKQIAANRSVYVAAGLTIMRAYLAAGAPRVCGPLGSYAAWSRMVRSPLVWLGEPDPTTSLEAIRAEDPDLANLHEFIELWIGSDLKINNEAYHTARIAEVACEQPAGFNRPVFKELLQQIAADKNGEVSNRRLGEWLRRMSGRIVIGRADGHKYQLVREQGRSGFARFRLLDLGE
jgi:putative DNA primase/helicase